MILLLLKYLKNLLVILFWTFKSSMRLYFDNILGFILNKAVNGPEKSMIQMVFMNFLPTCLDLDF